MDAKDQVRTEDQEPRAKDQPHDLFDYYTNTKNALACRGLRRAIVPDREPYRKRCPPADGAFNGNRSVELFDNAFRDGQAEAKAAPFRCHEFVEDRLQP